MGENRTQHSSGTYYHEETDPKVIALLERFRTIPHGPRLAIEYGDVTTGQAWGDRDTGRIGRSMGPVKIPIMLHNASSTGGGGLLEHCIVRVSYANKETGGILYQHPNYKPFHCDHCNTEHYVSEACVGGNA